MAAHPVQRALHSGKGVGLRRLVQVACVLCAAALPVSAQPPPEPESGWTGAGYRPAPLNRRAQHGFADYSPDVASIPAPPVTGESIGTAPAASLEERLLLPLLLQESTLLSNYGPDHPLIQAVRARQEAVRAFIAQQTGAARMEAKPAPSAAAAFSPAPLPPITPAPLPPIDEPKSSFTHVSVSPAPPPVVEPKSSVIQASFSPTPPPPAADRENGSRPEALKENPVPATPETKPARAEGRSDTPTTVSVAPAPASVLRESPAPLPEHQATPTAVSFVLPMGQLTTIAAALLAGLLVHAGALLLILRRYGMRGEQLLRLELVSPAGTALAGAAPQAWTAPRESAPHVETSRVREQTPERSAPPAAAPATPYVCEPSMDEGDALLRQVFEDNLRLREQIEALPNTV